jgi:hypothetical protein
MQPQETAVKKKPGPKPMAPEDKAFKKLTPEEISVLKARFAEEFRAEEQDAAAAPVQPMPSQTKPKITARVGARLWYIPPKRIANVGINSINVESPTRT